MDFSQPKRNPDSLTLVRRFSYEVSQESPHDPLVKGLSKHVVQEVEQENKGERLFSESVSQSLVITGGQHMFDFMDPQHGFPSTDLAALNEITQELEVEWKKVITQVTKKVDRKVNPAQISRPRKLEDFVRDAQEAFENRKLSRSGNLKEWLHKVAGGVYHHEHLLNMIPSNDNYFSVLVGGFKACIQASVEHQSIADTVSDCLDRLTDQTYHLMRVIHSSRWNKHIKKHILNFYTKLFRLLADILQEWLSSRARRIVHSFGGSFRTKITSSMEALGRHVSEVTQESNTIILEANNQHLNQLGTLLSRIGALSQGQLVMDSSFAVTGYTSPSPSPSPPRLTQKPSTSTTSTPPSHCNDTQHKPDLNPVQSPIQSPCWTTQTIRKHTTWMKPYTQTQEALLTTYIQRSYYHSVDRPLHHRLLEWATSPSSQSLWVRAPATRRSPSQNTLATAATIANFQKLQIPIIAYFCHYDPQHYASFTCAKELRDMVFSLLYQIALILPSDLSSSQIHAAEYRDLSPERIAKLAPDDVDDVESLPRAITLLKDMLHFTPPLLACCIDGLQILDRQEESEWFQTQFRAFLGVLAGAKPAHPRILKTWVATDGGCGALQGVVDEGEFQVYRVNYENKNESFLLRNIAREG